MLWMFITLINPLSLAGFGHANQGPNVKHYTTEDHLASGKLLQAVFICLHERILKMFFSADLGTQMF
jgi:hypothetical protein